MESSKTALMNPFAGWEETQIENGLADTAGGGAGGRKFRALTWGQLCDDLERWDGEGEGGLRGRR